MRLWVRRLIGAALLGAALAVHAPAAADQASNDAAGCLALVGGPTGEIAAALAKGGSLAGVVDDTQKGLAAAERYNSQGCQAYTQDYVFLALSGALTALVALGEEKGGLPDDYDAAQKKINDFIGKIIADIISAGLQEGSPFHALVAGWGEDFLKQLLQAIAEGTVSSLLETAKQQYPFVLLLTSYFDCAVTVATSGAAKKAKAAVDNYQGCAAFLQTCIGSLADCMAGIAGLGAAIASGVADLPGEIAGAVADAFNAAGKAVGQTATAFGEWVNCELAGPCLTPGVQRDARLDPQSYSYGPCPAGWVPGSWAEFDDITGKHHAKYVPNYYCKCPDNTHITANGDGTFACVCDNAKQAYKGGGVCSACPSGQTPDPQSGVCGLIANVCAKKAKAICIPPPGMVSNYDEDCSCVQSRLCENGSAYNTKTQKCDICPANHYANYGKNQPAGQCLECKANEMSKAGQTSCAKLTCDGKTHIFVASKPHQCTPCAKVAGKPICVVGEPKAKREALKPVCPPGTRRKGNTCETEIHERVPSDVGRPKKGVTTQPGRDGLRGQPAFVPGSTMPASPTRIQSAPPPRAPAPPPPAPPPPPAMPRAPMGR
jgi:hypothetical protein